MKKINLQNVKEFTGGFKQPNGAYVIKIVKAEDVAEKEYLKIYYDIEKAFDPNDEDLVHMYEKRFNDKGFDYPATIVSYSEKSLPFFKGFCTCIAKSNNGYDFEDTFDEKTLAGKFMGVCIQLEEYIGKDKYGNEKVKIRPYVAERHSVEAVMNGEVTPKPLKKLDATPKAKAPNPFETASAPAPTPTTEPENNPFATNTDEVPF